MKEDLDLEAAEDRKQPYDCGDPGCPSLASNGKEKLDLSHESVDGGT